MKLKKLSKVAFNNVVWDGNDDINSSIRFFFSHASIILTYDALINTSNPVYCLNSTSIKVNCSCICSSLQVSTLLFFHGHLCYHFFLEDIQQLVFTVLQDKRAQNAIEDFHHKGEGRNCVSTYLTGGFLL